MDELQKHIAALKGLANQPPTTETRAQAVASLAHKREGVQALALKALGAWGGRESADAIRGFLIAAFGRPHGWAIRSVAVRSLLSLIEVQDVAWVLNLYFSVPDRMHELYWLVQALPPESARPRLIQELSSLDWANRRAAVIAIATMPYLDWRELITPLLNDVHERVRIAAQAHLSRREQPGRVW